VVGTSKSIIETAYPDIPPASHWPFLAEIVAHRMWLNGPTNYAKLWQKLWLRPPRKTNSPSWLHKWPTLRPPPSLLAASPVGQMLMYATPADDWRRPWKIMQNRCKVKWKWKKNKPTHTLVCQAVNEQFHGNIVTLLLALDSSAVSWPVDQLGSSRSNPFTWPMLA